MIEHLSLSSIKTYLSCPRMFWFQYIYKPDILKSPYLILGTAVHKTIEDHVAEQTLTDGKSQQALIDRWPAALESAIESEPNIDWGRLDRETLYQTGVRAFSNFAVSSYFDTMRAQVLNGKPLIELFFKFEMDGVEVPILGYIDIVTEDGVPGDFKTAKRAWRPEQASREMQPLVYLMGMHSLGLNTDGKFRHYIIPTGNNSLQVLCGEYPDPRIEEMRSIIRNVWEGITCELFHPNPTYQWCGKYCSYSEYCEFG